ncbi:hypothetical protein S7711_10157 [Stachybotrys chartarum IBT 7711]|uniref:Uncharacterized protein n=1 Tax=Stachybotrys chartarum (strain CBS 109288 / IBT 7711) TaxID=1280523 RepID=A0A084B6R5_STACB|nr:hypothetical protein S7711_10157 [Stachybotrys chartarum IBT 7711]KFA79424.1 hypothetical protein S40288_09879 [Stachybotrys chartarum IBT 40288]
MEPVLDPTEDPSPSSTAAPDLTEEALRPTHYLEKIKVGNHGVQLLVSTKDHLYNANDVEAGESSWQVIGAWEDSSVSELTQMLSQRSAMASRTSEQTTGQMRYGAGYGTGKKLGTTPTDISETKK